MIAGINQTLDAVILPINESMKLAGRYASAIIPAVLMNLS
jgi:hypothetical protein